MINYTGKNNKMRLLTTTAVLSAIASVLMYIEFPVPLLPPFLKIDLSGVVVVIGFLILGMIPSISIIVIKNLIHLTVTQTGGVGELADFILLTVFILVLQIIILIFKRDGIKKMIIYCIISGIIFSLMGVLTNQHMLIPFYKNIMPIEEIINICQAVNPRISGLSTYLWIGVFPYNLLKIFLVCLIGIPVGYKLKKTIKI